MNSEKDLRQNKRVKASFYIRVEGKDAAGVPFSEIVRASDFSKAGTSFVLDRDIPIGEKLHISVPLPSVVVRIENFADSREKKYAVVFRPYHPEKEEE
ncbi:MAG: PilZ domain-containing protein [Acidobacteria bacterium]|nr:PilZ domain-containing protein [Acidobacteriota bacterium]